MGVEIERKFLVADVCWRLWIGAPGKKMRQGYLADGRTTVRVRMTDSEAWLTIKGPVEGISRAEYEYAIPQADAEEMLATLAVTPLVEKTRYRIPHEGLVIEVDEFSGENTGLVIAEVELTSEETPFSPPAWFGEEVTQDFRYHNSQLAIHPFRSWV